MDTSPPTILNAVERRVVGVMVEKAKTTPDAYPLSVNALTTGCNQKSNRDPVMSVSDEQVEGALATLQQRGLTTKITGGRVDRWRHNLYDVWSVDKVELAILAELFLRGAQTEGELRGHASRMEPIDDLDALRAKLRPLAERKLVVLLGELGRRGTQIADGFQSESTIERLRSGAAAAAAAGAPPVQETPAPSEMAALRQQVQDLQEAVRQLRADVDQLKAGAG